MSEFLNSIGYTLLIAFGIALVGISIRLVTDKSFRESIKIKEKKQILTSKEYYSKVIGIMAIVYGGAIITINSPPITSDFEYVMLLSGMTAIIFGAQLEINAQKTIKKSLMESESKISVALLSQRFVELERELDEANQYKSKYEKLRSSKHIQD